MKIRFPAFMCLFSAVWILSPLGCFTSNITKIDISKLEPAKKVIRINVPHISQNDNYSCGTTAIAMAISYYENRFNNPLDKEESWKISKSSKKFITRGSSKSIF